jgi:phosphatidylserine decarboxylase
MRRLIDRVFQQEDINFFLTNRIPRRQLTRLMGWFSGVEQPLVRDMSIGLWKLFAGDLNLHEARKERFSSLHDCFIRELKEGARPIDPAPDVMSARATALSAADARWNDADSSEVSTTRCAILLIDPALVDRHRDATTSLATSACITGFAPDGKWTESTVSGTGTSAVALSVSPGCSAERRAIVPMALSETGESITLVAVRAILVASIRLHFWRFHSICSAGRIGRMPRSIQARRRDGLLPARFDDCHASDVRPCPRSTRSRGCAHSNG